MSLAKGALKAFTQSDLSRRQKVHTHTHFIQCTTLMHLQLVSRLFSEADGHHEVINTREVMQMKVMTSS